MAVGVGKEVLFDFDNFKQPKTLSENETIARQIINLLMMRPGNLPSMPDVGINIEQYLYTLQEDLDSDEIIKQIYTQCGQLMPFISLREVKILIYPYNEVDWLIVYIPFSTVIEETGLYLGFNSTGSQVNVSYQFKDLANQN